MIDFAARIMHALTAGTAVQVNYANHSLSDTAHLRVATFNRNRRDGSVMEALIDGDVHALNHFTTRMDFVMIPSDDGNVQFTGSAGENTDKAHTLSVNGRSTLELVGTVLDTPNAPVEQLVALLALHARTEGARQRYEPALQNELVG